MERRKIKKAVWFITLKCNLKCSYCFPRQAQDPLLNHPFKTPGQWIEAWNRIEDEVVIDITGGEPMMQPGLIQILNGLDAGKKVALTTNLTKDVTQFAQKVSPEKCLSLTASLHPSQNMNVDCFLGKALLLKMRGFNVNVNLVAYPEQMWCIDRFKDLIEGNGLNFHVDPYVPGPEYPFTPSPHEREHLRRYVGDDRDNPYLEERTPYLCDAGMNYFVVQADGRVTPCVSRIYTEEQGLGSLFDASFQLRKGPMACRSKACSGCDVDKTQRIVTEEKRGQGEERGVDPVIGGVV